MQQMMGLINVCTHFQQIYIISKQSFQISPAQYRENMWYVIMLLNIALTTCLTIIKKYCDVECEILFFSFRFTTYLSYLAHLCDLVFCQVLALTE